MKPIALLALLLCASACPSPAAFRCQEDSDCDRGNGAFPRCQEGGLCSASDPGCDSGYRYDSTVGDDLGGTCVPSFDPGADGGTPPPRPCTLSLSAGRNHSCAVLRDGKGYCWGDDTPYGQIGNGEAGSARTAELVLAPVPLRSIAAGGFHSCAIADSGDLYCWGRAGRVPFDDPDHVQEPRLVAGVSNVDRVVLGEDHGCVLVGSTLSCWGDNSDGELGVPGNLSSSPSPVETIASGVTQVNLNADLGCAVVNGTASCWGREDSRLGRGDDTTTPGHTPTPVVNASGPLGGVTEVAVGTQHACAVDDQGQVWCWGRNNLGQLGLGTGTVGVPADSLVALPVPGLSDVVGISVGNDFSCARRDDGEVWCWGESTQQKLGRDGDPSTALPVLFDEVPDTPALTGTLALTSFYNHSCVVVDGGPGNERPKCWGAGGSFQLGNDIGNNQSDPVDVLGLLCISE